MQFLIIKSEIVAFVRVKYSHITFSINTLVITVCSIVTSVAVTFCTEDSTVTTLVINTLSGPYFPAIESATRSAYVFRGGLFSFAARAAAAFELGVVRG